MDGGETLLPLVALGQAAAVPLVNEGDYGASN